MKKQVDESNRQGLDKNAATEPWPPSRRFLHKEIDFSSGDPHNHGTESARTRSNL